jgi:hypothetical protein
MGLRSIAILIVFLLPKFVAAAEPLSYVILKQGEPIGHETVAITKNGDRTTVEVRTETRVKVLFLDFHYNHHREETWRSGQLEHMVADTDDDGTIHHIDVVRDASGMRLTLDGAAKEMPADALPLSLWGKAILDRRYLYGVSDAAPYRVTIQDLGAVSLVLNGQEMTAEHYRIAGEVERDLWYGDDGLLLKTTFERRGYPIEIVRE